MSETNREVGLDQLGKVIEDRLKNGQQVRMTVVGNSMFPLFRSKLDSVVLAPIVDGVKKRDVVLYKRSNGQYVLHRIIGRKGDIYSANGDNQYWIESPLFKNQFLGKMIGFYRKNQYYTTKTLWYQLYSLIWFFLRPFRGLLIKFLIYCAKIYRTREKKSEKK